MTASVYTTNALEANAFQSAGRTHLIHADISKGEGQSSTVYTIDGLLRDRAQRSPDLHILSYPSSGIDYVHYTLQQLDVFAWRLAKVYEAFLPVRKSSAETPVVVALLGPSNLEYLITILAITKLGHTILLLSTRITQPAIESLIKTTGATALIAGPKHMSLAGQVQMNLPQLSVGQIVGRAGFEFPIDSVGSTQMDQALDPKVEQNNISFIIHSSGSTGLPKPISQTQKSCLANYSVVEDMKAFITLPLFHNHGLCNFYRAVHSCVPIYHYNADLPLTHDNLVTTMQETQFEIFYGVPYALKLLAESDEGIRLLAQLKMVMYGGSPCPDDLGDRLVKSGVNLCSHYGATEVGQIMNSLRPLGDKGWNYVRENPRVKPYLKWIPRGPKLFECCVTDGWPSKVRSNTPDNSYLTSDLFEPHPTIPHAWKFVARRDDTLVLENGEKFGPVTMECSIRSNKLIQEVVVFGAGRPNLGLLVVPASSLKDETKEKILDTIWPIVDEVNQTVDAFGRIARDMIILLPSDCAYPRTDKGSIIRQAFYKTFKSDIDAIYDAQNIASANATKLDLPQLREYLRGLLSKITPSTEFNDDTDFFLLGMDSLQSIQMRSAIIKSIDLGGRTLSQNVVFEQPSIDNLSNYLHALGSGDNVSMRQPIEVQMKAALKKYCDISSTSASSVVVTGATGSLGAHVVAKLAGDPSIDTVFCLVRASSSIQASQRVKESILQRRLYQCLPLASRRKIVPLASDLTDPRLGLSRDDYSKIAQSLRSVIHCAWTVNFNLNLSSFEQSNIAGLQHLLQLCKYSPEPASFNFCSSISTCTRSPVSPVPEALPEFQWAQEMGYSQSKSIAEHICAGAAAQGVRARVLRVGQIVGDTVHGVWNAQEAVPMLMQTALTIGAVPKLKETPSWLPVDIVAQAVLDISLSNTDVTFANILHPQTFSFIDDLLPALHAAGLHFDEVEPREWVERLRTSNPDPITNPPFKLVDFFASKYDKEQPGHSKAFSTEVACSLSPALANAPPPDEKFLKHLIEYFINNAWAPTSSTSSKTVVVIIGLVSSGKTTIGSAISEWLGVPFIEGDALHPSTAAEKVRAGVGQNDANRATWLGRISSHIQESLVELEYDNVVLSCSALTRSSRSLIQTSIKAHGANAVLVDLQADRTTLAQRLQSLENRRVSVTTLDAQIIEMEPATVTEIDILPVDAEQKTGAVIDEAKWLLQERLGFPEAQRGR